MCCTMVKHGYIRFISHLLLRLRLFKINVTQVEKKMIRVFVC